MNMQCHEFEAELQESLDARLPLRLTAAALEHQASCRQCTRLASGLVALSNRLADVEAAAPSSRPARVNSAAWAGAALAASLCGVLLWSARRPNYDVPQHTQPGAEASAPTVVHNSLAWPPNMINGLRFPTLPGSISQRIDLPREQFVGMATFGMQPISSTVGAAVQALRHVISGDGEALAPPLFYSPAEPADSAACNGCAVWVA